MCSLKDIFFRKVHLDIKLDIQMSSSDLNIDKEKTESPVKNQAGFRTRRNSDPGPVKNL
jgi:hypothetical protein